MHTFIKSNLKKKRSLNVFLEIPIFFIDIQSVVLPNSHLIQ